MSSEKTALNQDFEVWPFNPDWSSVFIRTWLGLVTGIFISFLVFIILMLVWGIIEQAVSTQILGGWAVNPLLPLILIIIAFLWTFIGSIIIAWVYNLIYTDKYYDMWKMFSLVLFANIIMFILFLWLYVLFASGINQLFFVLAFHIMFTVFLSFTLIEMSTNPNYSAVHLLWAALWLIIWILLFGITYKVMDLTAWNSAHILLAIPPVLVYAMLPFWHWLREKIYYKFYSNWSNFFYIPSLQEVLVDEEEADDVEVDINID